MKGMKEMRGMRKMLRKLLAGMTAFALVMWTMPLAVLAEETVMEEGVSDEDAAPGAAEESGSGEGAAAEGDAAVGEETAGEETAVPGETVASEETAAPEETVTAEETAAPGETVTAEETVAPGETAVAEESAAVGEAAVPGEAAGLPAAHAEDDIASGSYGDIVWVIDASGKLTVSGTGDYAEPGGGYSRSPWYKYREQITSAEINVTGMTDASYMFYQCGYLVNVDVRNFDTENVVDMGSMFCYCASLGNLDVSNFNTQNVISMEMMFYNCIALTGLDLSKFRTENVAYMNEMFVNCTNLTSLDISSFSTGNVTTMEGMFLQCTSLIELNLSSFDTSNVMDMNSLASGCNSLQTVYTPQIMGDSTVGTDTLPAIFFDPEGNQTAELTNAFANTVLTKAGSEQMETQAGVVDGTNGLVTWTYDLETKTTVVTGKGTRTEVLSTNAPRFPMGTEYIRFENCELEGSLTRLFSGLSHLVSIDFFGLKTGNITDMEEMFKDCSSLESLDVSSFETGNVTNMGGMFYGCKSLSSLDVSNFETGNVKYMGWMFAYCDRLVSLDVSNFDTGSVMGMSGMFYDCGSLANVNVSSFETGNVTSMDNMFSGCYSLTNLDLSNFDTGNLTSMGNMFGCCGALTNLDLSGFDTRNVTDMDSVLYLCNSLESLRTPGLIGDNSSAVLPGIFSDPEGKQTDELTAFFANTTLTKVADLPEEQTGYVDGTDEMVTWTYDPRTKVTAVTGKGTRTKVPYSGTSCFPEGTKTVIFADCEIGGSFADLFRGLSSLVSVDFAGLQTVNITDTAFMFYDCSRLRELRWGSFDTKDVTDMSYMFSGCSRLVNLDVSNFDTSKVTAMGEFVYLCDSLQTLHTPKIMGSNITVTAFLPATFADPSGNTTTILTAEFADTVLTRVPEMQTGVVDGTNDMVTWTYDPNTKTTVVTGKGIRAGVQSADTPHFPVETEYIRFEECEIEGSMKELFKGMSNLNTIDFTGLKTVNVTDMGSMFMECGGLTELNLAGIDTGNVVNMNSLFAGCSGLAGLDLTGVDTSNVTDMSGMFSACSGLTELDLGSFDTGKVTSMSAMFWGCSGLTELDLTGFVTGNLTNMRYMFYGCSGLTELNLASFDTSNATNMGGMFDGCVSLQTLYAPQVMGSITATLPGEYFDPDGSRTEELTAAFANTVLTKASTEEPEPTEQPVTTQKPESTEQPVTTQEPEPTEQPVMTQEPEPTEQPVTTQEPETTEQPVTTQEPEPTEQPGTTQEPEPTVQPGVQAGVVDGTEGMITWTYDPVTKTVVVTGKGTRSNLAGRSAYSGASCFPEDTVHIRFEACEMGGSLAGLFAGLSRLGSIDFAGLKMSGITDMRHMFDGCSSLAELGLGNFATGDVTDMSGMFSGCSGLTGLDLGSFATGNVTDMSGMFSGCSSLAELNLGSFDTGNVTDMGDMLSGCDSLQTIHTPRRMGSAAAALPGVYAGPDGDQVEELAADHANMVLTRVKADDYLMSSEYEEIKDGLGAEEIKVIDYVLPDGQDVPQEEQKEIFAGLQDSGKVLSFVFQDENGGEVYRWTFQGNEIVDPGRTVDFQIIVDAREPEVLAAVPGDVQMVDLKFINEGALPGMANIKVEVESYFSADRLYLYYYNPGSGVLELVDDNVAFDGTFASFYLDHNSNYVLTAEMLRNLLPQDTDKPAKPGNPVKPSETAKPGNTAKPGEEVKPGNTAKPDETAKPDDPTEPGEEVKPDGTGSNQGGSNANDASSGGGSEENQESGVLQQHLVVKGDTLSKIARTYRTTVARLMALNPAVKNPNRIYAGQVIVVKDGGDAQNADTESGAYHVVRKGDSFYRIGRRYGIPLKDLLELNSVLATQKYIFPGQRVLLKLEKTEQ